MNGAEGGSTSSFCSKGLVLVRKLEACKCNMDRYENKLIIGVPEKEKLKGSIFVKSMKSCSDSDSI